MPVGAFSIHRLNTLLDKDLSSEKLMEALENLGCDVEGMDQLILHRCPNCEILLERFEDHLPIVKCKECAFEREDPFQEVDSRKVIRLDLLADRPDLLDVGGLTRALKGYLDISTGLPKYEIGESEMEVLIEGPPDYRPLIKCALVELDVDIELLREIMKLQESLHWALGRDRKLSSIGVYDLDTIEGPISYTSVDAEEFEFCPLGMPGKSLTPLDILEKHPKGTAFSGLLEGKNRVPILMDSREQVLSMPPIINSEETKIKEGTTRMFIDVTGTDEKPVRDTLHSLLCSLIELGGKVSSVKITDEGNRQVTPQLGSTEITIHPDRARKWIGVDFSDDELDQYLRRMRLEGRREDEAVTVSYPAYRSDIKHEVDIFEDIAIAIGYTNIEARLIPTMTVSDEREEETLAQVVRRIMTGLGFLEIMSLMQTTHERHFDHLGLERGSQHVLLANPKTADQNVLRCHLYTGIMEVFEKNRHGPKPQSFFEVGQVVRRDSSRETGTAQELRLVFGISDKEAGYADVRAVLDSLFRELNCKVAQAQYEATEHPTYIPGRVAQVSLNEIKGHLGEIHPRTLNHFSIPYPVALCEVKLMDVK